MKLRTVSELGEEDAVGYTLEDDTTLSVEFVDGLLPSEAIDDDETSCTNAEHDHHASVGGPDRKRSQNEQDG